MQREDVLSRLKLKTSTVNVPEWGGDVTIRELNLPERIEFSARQKACKGRELATLMAEMAVACCQNGVGPLFQSEDVKLLAEQTDGKVLDQLSDAIIELSGLSAKAVEASVKN